MGPAAALAEGQQRLGQRVAQRLVEVVAAQDAPVERRHDRVPGALDRLGGVVAGGNRAAEHEPQLRPGMRAASAPAAAPGGESCRVQRAATSTGEVAPRITRPARP